jgi:hypothetical protein
MIGSSFVRDQRRALLLLTLAAVVLASLAASKSNPIDFSGTWKLNMAKSKGAPDWRPETTIVILQGPTQIHFSYFLTPEAAQPFQSNSYVTNGREQQLYVAATETTYVSARWHKETELSVRTRHVVRSEIADTSWDETDSWIISADGKTLTNKQSDGKFLVFEKIRNAK